MSKYKEDNCKELSIFKYHVIDMKLKLPDKPEDLDRATCTKVKNAWEGFTYIDDEGLIWVDINQVHSILRTNKARVKREIGNIEDINKLRIGDKIFVRSYDISKIIDKFIQEEKISKRKEYLTYSENIYRAIRNCDAAEIIRTKHGNKKDVERKKLKRKRIKEYNIQFDELTGDKLIKNTAEFSHIRSFAIFKEISTNIENGLIVNKATHNIISQKGISDEVELLYLCEEKGWNINWYEKYRHYFNLK